MHVPTSDHARPHEMAQSSPREPDTVHVCQHHAPPKCLATHLSPKLCSRRRRSRIHLRESTEARIVQSQVLHFHQWDNPYIHHRVPTMILRETDPMCRCRSDRIFPGFNEMDTMPSVLYLRSISNASTRLPFRYFSLFSYKGNMHTFYSHICSGHTTARSTASCEKPCP